MIFNTVKVLVTTEVKLRMRRLSTLVAMFSVIALSWLMIPDQSTGMSLISIKGARAFYTSSVLAFGTASLAAILFGLGSFYLARGRFSEDIRSGAGGVIAASQIQNRLFLFTRWLGGVGYILTLIGGLLGTTLVLHAIRGHGPIELSIYLQTYAILLLPMVFFGVSCAILFDSIPFLMGKAGDVLFFVLWMVQLGMMASLDSPGNHSTSPLLLFDFSGVAVGMTSLQVAVNSTEVSVGYGDFNQALAPITLPTVLWSAQVILMRCASMVLALLPLLPAYVMFHRYSPDRVKVSAARKRRSPLTILNGWLRPLSRVVKPLFMLAAKLPGTSGQVVADIALTFVTSPVAIVVTIVALIGAATAGEANLPVWLAVLVTYWGILISDISTRDHAANAEDITGTVHGGKTNRILRQWLATMALGFMLMGGIALRWASEQPERALAVISGIVFLSALSSALGRFSRSPRTFIVLFLFAMYIALNDKKLAIVDMVGFNGSANFGSMGTQMMIASIAFVAAYFYNRQQAK